MALSLRKTLKRERLSAKEPGLVPAAEIEELAQRYAAQLVAGWPSTEPAPAEAVYGEIDVASLESTIPRTIGIEHVGMEALKVRLDRRAVSEKREGDVMILLGKSVTPVRAVKSVVAFVTNRFVL